MNHNYQKPSVKIKHSKTQDIDRTFDKIRNIVLKDFTGSVTIHFYEGKAKTLEYRYIEKCKTL